MSPTPKRYTAKNGRDTWQVRFRKDGRQTSETFATRTAAARFCADISLLGVDTAYERLLEQLTSSTAPTVDDVFGEVEVRMRRRARSERTAADARRDYENWIAPVFGDRRVSSLRTGEVQAWVDSMSDGTGPGGRVLAAKTIGDRVGLLHQIVKEAMSPSRPGGQVLMGDPVAAVVVPARRHQPVKGIMPAQWDDLYRELTARSQDGADLALFMVGTGWRFSEATGLCVDKVDDTGDAVHVLAGRVMRRGAKGSVRLVEDTKTIASRRRTLLDDHVADVVRHRAAVARAAGGARALVFTTGRGGMWRYSNFRRDVWDPATVAAGLEGVTPHELRHAHAGWLIMYGGVNLAQVRARLGHASSDTTARLYGSLVQDAQPDAVTAVAAVRAGARRAVLPGEVVPGSVVGGAVVGEITSQLP